MDLRNKKIAVLGLGREGQALAQYFSARKINADFFDENANASSSGIADLGFSVRLGKDAFTDLASYDLVFRSPGISPNLPALQAVKQKLTSLTALFFELWPGKTIGVTGTKGKGTTASLIKSILNAAGIKSVLVGNIGVVNLLGLDEYNSQSIAVMELSSFQLMDLGMSPNIAVVLDVTQEHMDYHTSLRQYQNAKLEIARYQKENDWLVVTGQNPLRNKLINASSSSTVEVYGELKAEPSALSVWWQNGTQYMRIKNHDTIMTTSEFPLQGEHNKVNASAAVAVGGIIGIDPATIRKAIVGFVNLPQRLEKIGTYGGINFVNDSASTNPATTIAAIKSFPGSLIVLVGGRNKGLDYHDLSQVIAISSNIKQVIFFGEVGGEMSSLCAASGCEHYTEVSTLDEAMAEVKRIARAGDTVLFSPGAASFDQFANYSQRGQKFNQLAHEYFTRKI